MVRAVVDFMDFGKSRFLRFCFGFQEADGTRWVCR